MIDWPSRALLGLVAAVVGFACGAAVLTGNVPALALLGSAPTPPPFALTPALPRSTPTSPPLGTPSTPGPNPATTPSSAAPTPSPTPQDRITLAFGGDVHGEPPISGVLDRGDNPLEGVAPWLSAADLAVVNLETAVGTAGAPADKTFTFQSDPSLADRLADAGVDVVTLANNHALDFGHEAAEETREILERAGVAPIGYGEDATEAFAPHVVDVGGRTVALLGLTRVMPVIEWGATSSRAGMASVYDIDRAIAAVESAAELADHVVVTIHWGQERATCPVQTQLDLARVMAAAGADVIVGHHPHVLQGVADVDGTLVAYSIGNFVFYATRSEQRETGVLTVTLSDDAPTYRWDAAQIDSSGRPQPRDDPSGEPRDRPSGRPPADADGCAPLA